MSQMPAHCDRPFERDDQQVEQLLGEEEADRGRRRRSRRSTTSAACAARSDARSAALTISRFRPARSRHVGASALLRGRRGLGRGRLGGSLRPRRLWRRGFAAGASFAGSAFGLAALRRPAWLRSRRRRRRLLRHARLRPRLRRPWRRSSPDRRRRPASCPGRRRPASRWRRSSAARRHGASALAGSAGAGGFGDFSDRGRRARRPPPSRTD